MASTLSRELRPPYRPHDAPLGAERAWVWLNRAYAKARGELVELRVKQTEDLARSRQTMDAPLDVLATKFWRTTMGTARGDGWTRTCGTGSSPTARWSTSSPPT